MTLYNYNLQRAVDSEAKTIEPYNRYEYAQDIETIGDVAQGYFKYQKAVNKAEETAKTKRNLEDENRFVMESRDALRAFERTPNKNDSELEVTMNEIYNNHPLMAPEHKFSYWNNLGYTPPKVLAVEAQKKGVELQAEKDAKDKLNFVDIARSILPSEQIENMSFEAQVIYGERAYNNQTFTVAVGQLANNSALDETSRNMLADVTAKQMQEYVQKDFESKPEYLTPEGFNKYQIEMEKNLATYTNYPPLVRKRIVQKATEPYKWISENIKQGRENALLYLKQRDEKEQIEIDRGFRAATHMDKGVYNSMVAMYGYSSEPVKTLIRNVTDAYGNYMVEQGGFVKNDKGDWVRTKDTPIVNISAQDAADAINYFLGNPLFTSEQKMNAATIQDVQGASDIAKVKASGFESDPEMQRTISHNFKEVLTQQEKLASELADAWKRATPEEKAGIRKTKMKYFEGAMRNDLALLRKEAVGSIALEDGYLVSYNENGDIEERDSALINAFNDNLDKLVDINDNAFNGELFSDKELDNFIKRTIVDYKLNVPGTKAPGSLMANVGGIVGADTAFGQLFGEEQGTPHDTQREYLINQEVRETNRRYQEAQRKAYDKKNGAGSYDKMIKQKQKEAYEAAAWYEKVLYNAIKAGQFVLHPVYEFPRWAYERREENLNRMYQNRNREEEERMQRIRDEVAQENEKKRLIKAAVDKVKEVYGEPDNFEAPTI